MPAIISDQSPEQPRREVFDYPRLHLRLEGVHPQALSVVTYGENPRLDHQKLLGELKRIERIPENVGDPFGMAHDLWLALSIPSRPLGGASIPQIGLLLPEVLGHPPYSDREKVILNAIIKRLSGFRGPGIFDDKMEPEAALDTVALRIAVALLAEDRFNQLDPLVFSTLIGLACNLCENRSLFAANPREAVVDRLIEFAQQELRLRPGLATLESKWEEFQGAPIQLRRSCTVVDAPKDYEQPPSWASFTIGSFFDTFFAKLTPWFQFGKLRNRQRFIQEIESAVAELSQEPEWFDPVASFRAGATFEKGPVLITEPSGETSHSWSYASHSEVGHNLFNQILTMFQEVGYHRWQLLLNQHVLSALLKELDLNLAGRDPNTLCQDLTKYWFTNQKRGTLHQFLGSANALSGPAFTKLTIWYDSLSQTISDVGNKSNIAPVVELAANIGALDLNQRILHVGGSLLEIAPRQKGEDLLLIPRVEVREAKLEDDEVLLYDRVLSSAVYTLCERLQLPNRSFVGIDPQKLYHATPWALTKDAIRGEMFPNVSHSVKGVILFYIDRDSDEDDQVISPERKPSEILQ